MLMFIGGVLLGFFYAHFFVPRVFGWVRERSKMPDHFPDSDHKHRKHLNEWEAGWDDFMRGKTVEGTKEYIERKDNLAQLQMKAIPVGFYSPTSLSCDYSFSRDVSTYSEPEWSAYLAGRRAATDEKNRRATVKQARADLIDLDTEKQTRYEQALRDLKEEIYGKESA